MNNNKVKIIAILSIIIIIAGIIMIMTKGYNFDLKYSDSKRILLNVGTTFNNQDIKSITDEVLGNQKVMIQKVEVFEDAVSITAKEITEEQKTNLINKMNEKYGTTTKTEDVEITTISHTRGRDIIKTYIVPFLIATIIIVIYMMIRYHKLNAFKVLLKTVCMVIYTQIMLFSIIAITRIPIGRLTIPMVLTVYILTLVGCTSRFENNLKKVEGAKNRE